MKSILRGYFVPVAATTFVAALLGSFASYGIVFVLLAPWIVLFAYPVAAVYVLVLGLPAFLFLRFFAAVDSRSYCLAGCVAGLVASLPQLWIIVSNGGWKPQYFGVIGSTICWYLAIGVICALSFRFFRATVARVA
jgi:hypothetical protein